MIFCRNCDSEAVAKVTHPDNVVTPLCQSCRQAYEWGQASPGSTVSVLEDSDPDDMLEASYCDAAGNCYSDADPCL